MDQWRATEGRIIILHAVANYKIIFDRLDSD
jgi:hypothetical protein